MPTGVVRAGIAFLYQPPGQQAQGNVSGLLTLQDQISASTKKATNFSFLL